MYARVAKFSGGDPDRIDEVIDGVSQMVRSGEQSLPGATRFVMLVDRTDASALGVTFFESEHDVQEAEPMFEAMLPPVPDAGGGRESVAVYEVAVDEELEPGPEPDVSILDTAEPGMR